MTTVSASLAQLDEEPLGRVGVVEGEIDDQ